MRRIRVALGEVHSAILRDILTQITELEPDMELVGDAGQANVRAAVAREQVDVVICDVQPDELPQVARDLFANGDRPVVVGLAREGRDATVCIADAGPAQLMGVIRSAIEGSAAPDKVVELVRPREAGAETEPVAPYTSNADCINDQLGLLDLALLAEIDVLESTIWDESVQRLQGLAISPGEVRALLDKRTAPTAPRQTAELRRKRIRLSELVTARIMATLGDAEAPAFVRLVERFRLNPFEQFCITSTLALEVDRNKYGKAYALLQDDVTRKQPSLELLLRLYEGLGAGDRWVIPQALDAGRPLRRWHLLRLTPREAGEPGTPFGRRLELDDRLSRLLLGVNDLGSPLDDVATLALWDLDTLRVAPPGAVEDRLADFVDRVRRGVTAAPSRVVVHVHGRPGSGRRSLVASICQRHQLRVLRVDAARLAALPPATLDETLQLLTRETLLLPTAVCLENADGLIADEAGPSGAALRTIAHGMRSLAPVAFIIGERAWPTDGLFGDGVFKSILLPLPRPDEARQLWAEELADLPLDPETGGVERTAVELAARFTLSSGQIHDAAASARSLVLWRQSGGSHLTLADLYACCRDQCSHLLATLARQVTTTFAWRDLILPADQHDQLIELETAIRNCRAVLADWNFESRLPYGRGITALFSGPSGTGKTMAAGILARELGLDLYKIDLSRVVSKYIGETEKNLDRIFAQAEDANAMLFFDEADALFGKRSAIKDAHDRYANIEVAYLLQKMEEREGVTILATNLMANMDEAFTRRIRFAIEFPMPEQDERLEIWRRSMPAEARLAADVDLSLLARRLRISGGSIMNISVGAASLAYKPGGQIHMRHLLYAAKRELQKLGYQYGESDFPAEAMAGVLPSAGRGGR